MSSVLGLTCVWHACPSAFTTFVAMDPPYLGLLKGNYGISSMGWFKSYQAAFINTSRFRPIQHVIGFVVLLGYALEYPHLKHEQHSRKKKAALEGH